MDSGLAPESLKFSRVQLLNLNVLVMQCKRCFFALQWSRQWAVSEQREFELRFVAKYFVVMLLF